MGKYRSDFPKRAYEMAQAGMIDRQIWKELGVSRGSYYKYRERYPEFAEAIDEGKERPDRKVEAALYKNAIGYDYEEVEERETETKNGLVTLKKTTKKHVPGNIAAQIFWLKNRRRDRWKDKWEIEFDELNIKVNLVD